MNDGEHLTLAINRKIDAKLESFRPVGCHDGVCESDKECCWHFSDYFYHHAGRSAIFAWLETYAERNVSLSNLLEEFAFFSSFLNDRFLIGNLARGIALFATELVRRVIDFKGRKFKVAVKNVEEKLETTVQSLDVDMLDVFNSCGWKETPFLTTRDATMFSLQRIDALAPFIRFILSNEASQKPKRAIFSFICVPLLSSYCANADNIIGNFYSEFFRKLLFTQTFVDYKAALKCILLRTRGQNCCNSVMTIFSTVRNVNEDKPPSVERTRKRCDIERRHKEFSVLLTKCR